MSVVFTAQAQRLRGLVFVAFLKSEF